MPPTAAQTLRIDEPAALGSVTLAPRYMTGCSESDLARSMAHAVSDAGQMSVAAALRELRETFPDMPLALRVAALGFLGRK